MDEFTEYQRNEIAVDFESDWFQALVESQYNEDVPDYDGYVVERSRTPHVEVRQVQYLLGRHVRTREVRIITNRPVPVEPVEVCELCGCEDAQLVDRYQMRVCGPCELGWVHSEDVAAGIENDWYDDLDDRFEAFQARMAELGSEFVWVDGDSQ